MFEFLAKIHAFASIRSHSAHILDVLQHIHTHAFLETGAKIIAAQAGHFTIRKERAAIIKANFFFQIRK